MQTNPPLALNSYPNSIFKRLEPLGSFFVAIIYFLGAASALYRILQLVNQSAAIALESTRVVPNICSTNSIKSMELKVWLLAQPKKAGHKIGSSENSFLTIGVSEKVWKTVDAVDRTKMPAEIFSLSGLNYMNKYTHSDLQTTQRKFTA